ncbi:type II toxin-antitoxin system VapC family toxin [Ciceribacter sp. L1K23]|uniref:type II toxin-antitoxin system VapC family toxin n=1 Tax=Ciceribacter sp. L1K23 TaxID=2820276 RepID=UPI001B83C285|nr:type II toxin-antitoxin system VapC family toxin [Ciceribacter sp. L1K23]MBR0554985.1 type II toxin-antitoxin system VapC family toxin [Ciceribacter sp. L1K23]
MVYVDTSVFVALLTNEASAPRVMEWLKRQPSGSVHVSGWTITEFSSAVAIKIRTRQIDTSQRQAALTAFNRLLSTSLNVLQVNASDYLAAARFCDREELGLRAGDGLHVAVAMYGGLSLATLDVKLAEACTAFGVSSKLL